MLPLLGILDSQHLVMCSGTDIWQWRRDFELIEQAEQWLVSSKSGPFTTELGPSSDFTRTCQRQ
jgi:hypothetical protein